jgi:ABC-type antimicrobial peptide transport system permease subunit
MPGMSYINVVSMNEVVSPNIAQWQLGATMFTIFGAIALLLAAIGLYSVIAYNVAQQSHELGVRVALGAQSRDVVRHVMRQGIGVAVVGLTLGLAIAAVASRFVTPLLYKVEPRDPMVFAGVAAVLLLVAVVASLVPARRASRVDPAVALRSD